MPVLSTTTLVVILGLSVILAAASLASRDTNWTAVTVEIVVGVAAGMALYFRFLGSL